ncbi:unnamed protein product [Symbiodinium sp. CCMP2456]|nr:unnamed protein product [Symbiodinium sp. CCMP2456]
MPYLSAMSMAFANAQVPCERPETALAVSQDIDWHFDVPNEHSNQVNPTSRRSRLSPHPLLVPKQDLVDPDVVTGVQMPSTPARKAFQTCSPFSSPLSCRASIIKAPSASGGWATPLQVPRRPMWNRGGSTSKDTEQQSLLGAVAGIYAELLKGAECGVPESVTYDRSAEIDLSHEFPPEQREAQVDPEAAFHRPLRVGFAETASIQVAT